MSATFDARFLPLKAALLLAGFFGVIACNGAREPSATSTAAVRISEPVAETTPSKENSGRPRVVVLGDSLTAGLGLPREQSVPSLIQARLDAEGYDYEVVNAGVSGDTSAGGVRRLDWALDGDVEILVVELGANDGLRGLPVAQMKQNLNEIIERARQRDITVILTGMEAPPNYGPLYTSEFRRAFRDLANDHDVVFVPFFLEGVDLFSTPFTALYTRIWADLREEVRRSHEFAAG